MPCLTACCAHACVMLSDAYSTSALLCTILQVDRNIISWNRVVSSVVIDKAALLPVMTAHSRCTVKLPVPLVFTSDCMSVLCAGAPAWSARSVCMQFIDYPQSTLQSDVIVSNTE